MTDDAMPTYGSFGSKIPPLANDSPELHECDKCGLRTALPPKIVDGVPHYFCSLHCQESVSIRKSTR